MVAISSGRPIRFMAAGELASACSRQDLAMSVQNGPHMMALTRTLGPNSMAWAWVMMLSAALAPA